MDKTILQMFKRNFRLNIEPQISRLKASLLGSIKSLTEGNTIELDTLVRIPVGDDLGNDRLITKVSGSTAYYDDEFENEKGMPLNDLCIEELSNIVEQVIEKLSKLSIRNR